ncbi:BTAD domain-containing putative transcriptional regulator [Kutzneria sp. NPDC052558]|uniref:BTAD domain-containing putative transcriptional regulator n=1 Tax=Kutzneria sp. NPDC052558 TaxID=3364121 RepID=UPI0037CC2D2B
MELTPSALSALLRQRRVELGITQAELARRAGLGIRTVRYLEQGQIRRPRTASVRQLLAVLASDGQSAAPTADLWIGVLGPLMIVRDGRTIELGETRPACLLGLLALNPNRPLPLDDVAETLWSGRPPASCAGLVNRYVRQLRRLLGPRLCLVRIGHGGYQLDAEPSQLDMLEFGALAARARSEQTPDAACETYAQALACWRGPVLAGKEQLAWHPAAVALSQQRLSAALAHADVSCRLGRHEQIVTQLEPVRADEPLHEGLHARLMVALAGAGQRPAAIDLFDDLAARLRTELGIEPGPELQAAQLQVLRDEPIPRASDNFLPRTVDDFVGRAAEIEALAARSTVVCALNGMAGVGKTTLAVHIGHRLADRFPDGQLYVDLRTHSAERGPLTAQGALDALLRQLGVDGHRIPEQVDHSAALWRSLLVGRRLLVVLDDVADAAQVRPLLPGGGTECGVVITSRARLTSLEAVRMMALDVLGEHEAVELFTRIVGERRVADCHEGVQELVRLCGLLPLAIRIAAGRLRDRPLWTMEHLLTSLRDEHRRLPALSAGDRSVDAALALSCRHLTDRQRRLFQGLGDFLGVDITADAATAITGHGPAETASLLEGLLDVHLLHQSTLDRYRMHDLVRDHARTIGDADPAIAGRVLDHYIHMAGQAADVLEPTRKRFPASSPPPAHLRGLATTEHALSWFEAERVNLVSLAAGAATHGQHERCWRLVQTLWRYFFIRGHLHDLIETHRTALACTQRLGDTAAEAEIRKSLGLGYWRMGRPAEAIEQHDLALALDRANRDPWDEAKTHNHLGFIHARDGDPARALVHHHRSAELYHQTGDHCGAARAYVGLGDLHYHAGRIDESAAWFRKALALAQEVGDRWSESLARIGLGFTSPPPQARAHLELALELTRATGDRWGESMALTGLGAILAGTDNVAEAINLYRQAVALSQQIGDRWWEQLATAGLAGLQDP